MKRLEEIVGALKAARTSYTVASHEQDLTHVVSLRRDIFVEEVGFIAEESDPYDMIAANLLAREDGRPVGTLRAILEGDLHKLRGLPGVIEYDGETRFLVEEAVDLSRHRNDPSRKSVEYSRLMVVKERRRTPLTLGLMAAGYYFARRAGVTDAFIMANCEMGNGRRDLAPHERPARIPRLFRSFGFKPISKPFFCERYSGWQVPMHCDEEGLAYQCIALAGILLRQGIIDAAGMQQAVPYSGTKVGVGAGDKR